MMENHGITSGSFVLKENQHQTVEEVAVAKTHLLYNIFMQSPAMHCLLRGPEHTFVLINEPYRRLIGDRDPLGKNIKDALPELEGQGIFEILDRIYLTGEPFTGNEMPVVLDHGEKKKTIFLNFNCQLFTAAETDLKEILVFAYDVTEQVEARNKINESKRKYRNLVYSLPVALYSCDANGYVQLYNDAAEKLWGRKPNIGKDLWCGSWKIFKTDGEPLPLNECPMAIALKEGRISNTEIVIERPDGTQRNVIPHPQPVFDLHGNITGATNTLVDITDQLKTRKELQQVAKMVERLYMNAPAFICTVTGPDHVFELVNPEYQKLYGSRQLVGKKVADALPELVSQGIIKRLDKVFETGESYVVTEFLVHLSRDEGKELEPTYLNYSYQAMYDAEENIIGILIFGYEVTEQVLARQKGEENLKLVLESLPQITSTSSADGTNIFFNKFFFEYSGLSKEEATINGWNSILHPEEIDEVLNQWEECKKRGCDFYREIRLKRKSDGVYRWHISHITPIKNNKGEIVQWIATATDIHEQKIKEQKKDEFLSIASHELKTPLTSVSAYLQLLQITPHEDIERSTLYTEKALQSVERLKELISELLDVSKIQNGKLNLNMTTFNFTKMVNECIEATQYTGSKHMILRSGEIAGDFYGDEERLKQVVINLLSNAIKYSPDAETVEVDLSEKDGEITVSVKDYGIGISADNLKRIFERYYRVEGQDIHFQGLGIGLFISMDIIQRHDGKLYVESEPGKGSTFYFTLKNKARSIR
jgi:PAS domain S-box-containing protein